jgi:hypothetical protein
MAGFNVWLPKHAEVRLFSLHYGASAPRAAKEFQWRPRIEETPGGIPCVPAILGFAKSLSD